MVAVLIRVFLSGARGGAGMDDVVGTRGGRTAF
jgi:hypothetical protein